MRQKADLTNPYSTPFFPLLRLRLLLQFEVLLISIDPCVVIYVCGQQALCILGVLCQWLENDGHSTSYILYSLYPPLSRLPAPAGSPGSRVCCIVMRTEECALPGVFRGRRGTIKGKMLLKHKHVLIINMDLSPKMSLMLDSVWRAGAGCVW